MGVSGQLLDITRMQLMLMAAQRKTLKLAAVASQLNQVAGQKVDRTTLRQLQRKVERLAADSDVPDIDLLVTTHREQEVALGKRLSVPTFGFLASRFARTRDQPMLAFLDEAYAVMSNPHTTMPEAASLLKPLAVKYRPDARPRSPETLQALEALRHMGLVIDDDRPPPRTEDEVRGRCASFAEGFVCGKWDLIRGQCRVCHTTEVLLGDDKHFGFCKICEMGYCSEACHQQHVLVEHTLG